MPPSGVWLAWVLDVTVVGGSPPGWCERKMVVAVGLAADSQQWTRLPSDSPTVVRLLVIAGLGVLM